MQWLLGQERQRRRADIAAPTPPATPPPPTVPPTPAPAATAPIKVVPATLTIWPILRPTPATVPAVPTFASLLRPTATSVPAMAAQPLLAITLGRGAMITHVRPA